MQLEIWSDIVCPWCYIGKRRLEAALATLPQRDQLTILWRSFELDSRAPDGDERPLETILAQKYGVPVAQARTMMSRVVETGAEVGLTMRFDLAKQANTLKAHKLLHEAKRHDLADAMKERLMRAYFCEGARLSDDATLIALAGEVGLSEDDARRALTDPALERAVREDQARAQAIGVRGVPFFVIDGKYGISGAQPSEVLAQAITQALAEAAPATSEGGELCDDAGCEVP